MRAFAAMLLPDEIKDYAARCQSNLARLKLPVRWVARDNYHLTVKFLGDVPEGRLEDIKKVLFSCTSGKPAFNLRAEGLGCFPRWNRPRVLWLGMSGDTVPALDLMDHIDRVLVRQGFKREDHQLHLTLGRVRQGQEAAAGEIVSRHQGRLLNPDPSSDFKIDALYLMESQLSSSGPAYYIIDRFPLQESAF